MTTLLKISTSLYGEAGQSSQLAERFVQQWLRQHPNGKVLARDLARNALPHLDAERFQAFITKPEERSAAQKAVVAESDALIKELQDAQIIVLGLPMYNFGLPSTLKAWFDHIARAGVTFRYTASGPEGLLKGKKAYVFATRGGQYQGTPLDTQTSYVRDFLGFLGIAEVEFVYAENLAISAEAKQASIARAQDTIGQLLAPAALAA